MKKAYKRNLWTKLRALISGDIIKGIKKGLDYESMGGATFLGLQKAVVKGHGNSKAPAISVCIAQAANAVRGDMVGKIKEMIDGTDMDAITAQITAEQH
jgi:glycerol-3-phosphate acyltransferase PlsX